MISFYYANLRKANLFKDYFNKKRLAILEFTRFASFIRAGDEGIEPPPKVLETPIIPLDQSPTNIK